MTKEFISFAKTGKFSSLLINYLENHKAIRSFFNRTPTFENFKMQCDEKQAHFSASQRSLLVKTLKRQHQLLPNNHKVLKHIDALSEANAFTVTTGHQLNLFTGPIYFLYKIIDTLILAQELQKKHPKKTILPVFWMASEDHDFEEVNHFYFKGQKVRWESKEKGAVGSFSTKGLDVLLNHFAKVLGKSISAQTLKKWFKESYFSHTTLSEATRFLIHQLFGEYGLIILDANDPDLKRSMIPYFQKELFENTTFETVSKTNQKLLKALGSHTDIQVNPRKINLFYCTDQQRNRIVQKDNLFTVLNTNISFSRQEIMDEMDQNPERFSPNVLLRPLYQEVLLPNLAYVGGGGELAYWLQLKSTFEHFCVPFPILKLRTSVLLVSTKQAKKIKKLALTYADLFLDSSSLINYRVRTISNIDIDFTPQKEMLSNQFRQLYDIAEQTDASFLGAVKAQEKKQRNGLDALEKRLLLAQRRKLADEVRRISDLQNDLFPNKSLQERQLNFSELYLEYGEELIPALMQSFNPLQFEFMILELNQQN